MPLDEGWEEFMITRWTSKDETPTNHMYPFDTLPLLESHLHPKFVIFNSGKKLKGLLDYDKYTKLLEQFPLLGQVEEVYMAWLDDLPIEEDDASYNLNAPVDSDDDYDDSDDVIVDDPRDNDYVLDKRSMKASQKRKLSPRPKRSPNKRQKPGANRKVLSAVISNIEPLSEVKLSSHNHQVGGAAWTHDRIRRWSRPFHKKRKLGPSHSFL